MDDGRNRVSAHELQKPGRIKGETERARWSGEIKTFGRGG